MMLNEENLDNIVIESEKMVCQMVFELSPNILHRRG